MCLLFLVRRKGECVVFLCIAVGGGVMAVKYALNVLLETIFERTSRSLLNSLKNDRLFPLDVHVF